MRPARAAALLCAATLLGHLAACAPRQLTVGVAASLSNAFGALTEAFETRQGMAVSLNAAASGVLEAQLRAGAPMDLLATASPLEPERLHKDGLVETPVEFARNRLVVAVRAGADPPGILEDLTQSGVRRIALGAPETVPSGRYATDALRAAGIELRVRGKLVPCEDVRQALAYLVRGEVDAAFVYATDLRAAPEAPAALVVPDSLYAPIRYLACVTSRSERREAARRFLEFVLSEEGQALLREHGFRPPAPEPGA